MKYRMIETRTSDVTVTVDGGTATIVWTIYDMDERTGISTKRRAATAILPDTEYLAWAARDETSSERLTLLDAQDTRSPRP